MFTRPISRRLGAFALAASLVVTAGCGSASDGGGKDKSFTYWSLWKKGEPQQLVLQKAFDEFTKKTGITVNAQWQGREVMAKVRTNLNTDQVPDLVDHDANTLSAGLNANNQALGLQSVYDSTIDGESVTVGDVIPKKFIEGLNTKDGQPFIVPYEIISSAFWYNAAEHPDIAANPPTDFASLLKLMDDIKATGLPPVTEDTDSYYNLYWLYWAAMRYGGPGSLKAAAGDKTGALWHSPDMIKAAQMVETIVKGKYLLDGWDATQWPTQQTAWANNKAALLLMGSWAPSETAAVAAPGFDYRSFPFPTVPGGKGNESQEGYSIGFSIPAKAKHADAAKQFISFFMNKDRIAGISKVALNLTPRTDVEVPSQLADLKKMIDAAPSVHALYDGVDGAYPDYATQVLIPLSDKLLRGEISAADFSKQIEEKSKSFWESA